VERLAVARDDLVSGILRALLFLAHRVSPRAVAKGGSSFSRFGIDEEGQPITQTPTSSTAVENKRAAGSSNVEPAARLF
jgi:hypothetical protein